MSHTNTSEYDDFSDLGFDVERHREALISFARLNMEQASIRPALRARDLVFVRLPSSRFALGVTDDPHGQEKEEASRGGIGFEMIHEAHSVAEASRVRDEVERYFLRHYPGRILPRPVEGQAALARGVCVYITCHDSSDGVDDEDNT